MPSCSSGARRSAKRPRASTAHAEGLPSTDVVSRVLHFCRVLPDDGCGTYRLQLRSTNKLWSLAFGQYVEMWVVPRGTAVDGAGCAIWTPDRRRANAELLLFLLHVEHGLTRRLTTSFLYGLKLVSPLPRALVQLRPRTPITAVRKLVVGEDEGDCERYSPSAEELDAALDFFPNLTSISLDTRRLGLAGVLRMPPTVEELFLSGLDRELASDAAVEQLMRRFPGLRRLLLPWSAAMTGSTSSLLAKSSLTDLVIEQLEPYDGCVLEPLFGMVGLSSLALEQSELTTLPDAVGRLSNLVEMCLRSRKQSRLTALPESFGGLRALQKLSVQWSRLSSLPTSFGQLSNLQELCLDSNQLTALPTSFGRLSNLRELSLGGAWVYQSRRSRLTALPEPFGCLRALQKFKADGNQLGSLPTSFGQLSNLRELSLRLTELAALPHSFGCLRALQKFEADKSQLSSLPTSFGQLSNLRELSICGNKLTALPDSFGYGTEWLTYGKSITAPASWWLLHPGSCFSLLLP